MAYDLETRDTLIAQLKLLSHADDAIALAAARAVAGIIDAQDLDWEAMMPPAARPARAPLAATGSDADVIRALLARDDLFPDTREDLTDFLAQAESGRLSEDDRAYVHALNQRLTQR